MFELPRLDVDDFELMADWVELCVICGESETVSRELVEDTFKDAGLFATEIGDIPAGDYSLTDAMDFSSDDELETLSEPIWRILRRRQNRRTFPYSIHRHTIRRTIEDWSQAPAFTMLLLADISRQYVSPLKEVSLTADGVSGRLFEKIVEASVFKLLPGSCARFGWKPDKDWPRSFDDRLAYLADQLGLKLENLDGKTFPTDKDRGLDVLARLEFGNGQHACPYFFVQCAVGKNWKSKTGEPMPESWQSLMQWCGPFVRIVAIPWRLTSRWDYKRAYSHFGAAILDRPRLNHGIPDIRLDESTRVEITKWCKRQLARIPLLK